MRIKIEFNEDSKFYSFIKKKFNILKNKLNNYITKTFLEKRFKQYVIEQELLERERVNKEMSERYNYLITYPIIKSENKTSINKHKDARNEILKLMYKTETGDYVVGSIDPRVTTIDGIKAIAKERGIKLEKLKIKDRKIDFTNVDKNWSSGLKH